MCSLEVRKFSLIGNNESIRWFERILLKIKQIGNKFLQLTISSPYNYNNFVNFIIHLTCMQVTYLNLLGSLMNLRTIVKFLQLMTTYLLYLKSSLKGQLNKLFRILEYFLHTKKRDMHLLLFHRAKGAINDFVSE